jgi:hypothetical protein
MTDDLVVAVERLEQRGYEPASLDAIADELRWAGPSADLESSLDQRVRDGNLSRYKRDACDPEYSTR